MKYWTKLTKDITPEGIPAGWPIEKITANEWQQESPGPEWQLLDETEIKELEAPHKETVRAIADTIAQAKWVELTEKMRPAPKRDYVDPSKGRFYLDEYGKLQFEPAVEAEVVK